jgi:iron complex outermembrane recepter protein
MPKYVGRQYLDNTSNPDRMIHAYFVNDLQLSYSFKLAHADEIKLTLLVNNILNEMYESNGWTYPYYYNGVLVNDNYYYPQAGRNFLAGVSLKF